MTVGVRAEELRKVYRSPPPAAGRPAAPFAGRLAPRAAAEIVALNGLTLEIRPGEISHGASAVHAMARTLGGGGPNAAPDRPGPPRRRMPSARGASQHRARGLVVLT